jgi:group I intron endonuclease
MQSTFYTIYKIINHVNNKIYIGKHQTTDLNDSYMGSGKLLKRAIKKYGIENFTKIILHVYNTENDMNLKEKELVTEDFCLRPDTYNICAGGKGGFGYINKSILIGEKRKEITKQNLLSRETRNKIANTIKVTRRTEEYRTKLSISIKNSEKFQHVIKTRSPPFLGKTHSTESICKMRESAAGKHTGSKNSQHGTMWITNGIENKKIKKDQGAIPEGWYTGRKMNNTQP